MPVAGTASARDPFIDGLRGLALCGVLVVNSLSFPHVFSSPIGVVDPVGSPLALAVHALAAALFQAKSYPLLMFLVGYAWAIRVRRNQGQDWQALVTTRRRQMLRQGLLGLAHGLFIYFGDILSWLALLGILLVGAPRLRLRRLQRRIVGWTVLWLVLGGSTLLSLMAWSEPLPGGGHWLTDARSWPEVFELQRLGYLSYLFQAHVQLPMMLALGLLGVLAARLRVLERRRIGAPVWAFGIRWLLPAGVIVNLAVASWLVALQTGSAGDFTPSDLASQFTGPLLAAGVVCLLARAWHAGGARWLGALAPLGRMTMSCYVAHTLVCMALFAGPAGALGPRFGSIGLLQFGLAFWALSVLIAPVWQTYVGAGPLERWVRGAGLARGAGGAGGTSGTSGVSRAR